MSGSGIRDFPRAPVDVDKSKLPIVDPGSAGCEDTSGKDEICKNLLQIAAVQLDPNIIEDKSGLNLGSEGIDDPANKAFNYDSYVGKYVDEVLGTGSITNSKKNAMKGTLKNVIYQAFQSIFNEKAPPPSQACKNIENETFDSALQKLSYETNLGWGAAMINILIIIIFGFALLFLNSSMSFGSLSPMTMLGVKGSILVVSVVLLFFYAIGLVAREHKRFEEQSKPKGSDIASRYGFSIIALVAFGVISFMTSPTNEFGNLGLLMSVGIVGIVLSSTVGIPVDPYAPIGFAIIALITIVYIMIIRIGYLNIPNYINWGILGLLVIFNIIYSALAGSSMDKIKCGKKSAELGLVSRTAVGFGSASVFTLTVLLAISIYYGSNKK